MAVLRASCLCGRNRLDVHVAQAVLPYYQCYCSLCRKASGTGSNLATLLHKQQVIWHEENTQTYRKDSGFCHVFCGHCGVSLPNVLGDSDYVWLPLGIVDSPFLGIHKVDVCLASIWSWYKSNPTAVAYQSTPESLDVLYQTLQAV